MADARCPCGVVLEAYSGRGRPRLWCVVCRPSLPDRHHRLVVVRSPRCVDCGGDLPVMHSPGQLRRRCVPCKAAHKLERDRQYRLTRRDQLRVYLRGYHGERRVIHTDWPR